MAKGLVAAAAVEAPGGGHEGGKDCLPISGWNLR